VWQSAFSLHQKPRKTSGDNAKSGDEAFELHPLTDCHTARIEFVEHSTSRASAHA
jgi:hypothetical protein